MRTLNKIFLDIFFYFSFCYINSEMLDQGFDHFIGFIQQHSFISPGSQRWPEFGCIECMITDEILQLSPLPVIQFTELHTAFTNGKRI